MSPRCVARTAPGGILPAPRGGPVRTAPGGPLQAVRAVAGGRQPAGGQAGQATVELVALLPVLVIVLAGAWQAVLAGHAAWAATTAARAAARANAVGSDPMRAARTHLPRSLEHGVRVRTGSDGDVHVRVRIPSLPGLPSLGHAGADARFEPQS